VVVVVLVFVGSMGADKTGVQADSAPARSSTSSGSPRPQATLPSDDGVVALPDGKWLLTPGWTFPLSIHGADRDAALEVKRLLDRTREERPSEVYAPLSRIIFEKGIRVDQVEDFFRENGPKYREELKRLTVGEDQDFIEDETRRKAVKVLDVWLPQEPWSLYEGVEPLTAADLEAIGRFGHDVLEVCLRGSTEPGQVEAMNPDDPRVAVFERLVAEGLAEALAVIPAQDLLPVLRLDELRGMLKVAGGPPVKRKADAVAFLQDRADLRALLNSSGCTRKFFRPVPAGEKFGGADLARIGSHLPRAWATAQLLADTYSSTYYSSRAVWPCPDFVDG
jgi:hypothetical protein